MNGRRLSLAVFIVSVFSGVAWATGDDPEVPASASPSAGTGLTVSLRALDENGSIKPRFAFCQPDLRRHTRDGDNISPAISWSAGPEGTASYVLIMHDPDVPTVFDNANKERKVIPEDMPRQDFVHWVLTDIPAAITSLPEGADSAGIDRKGKPAVRTSYGQRGINDYSKHMDGQFAGYDGPCPPWNDQRIHHYIFTVYAVDVPSLGLTPPFGREEVLDAMKGHTLMQGAASGTYTQNEQLLQ